MKPHTIDIQNSFSKAENYDDYAIIQPIVADILAEIIPARLRGKKIRRILELGAGTGALTLKIAPLFPYAEYICTDLSEDMLKRAQEKTKNLSQNISFLQLDMENFPNDLPDDHILSEGFDLIISNLAFQWVKDRPFTLRRIYTALEENGAAFLTTLLDGSLREWRYACKTAENPCSVPLYPSISELEAEYTEAKWKKYQIQEEVKNAISFLKGLKEIGAAPKGLSSGQKSQKLKSAIHFFDQNYQKVTYEIGLGELYK